MRMLPGAPRTFDIDHLNIQHRRDASDDVVLAFRERCQRQIEAVGPDLRARLAGGQLRINPDGISNSADAPLEQVAHPEFVSDLPRVDAAFAFIGKGGAMGSD